MKSFFSFFIFGLLACSSLSAQKAKRVNTLSLEAGKTGFIANLTFDSKGAQSKIGFRSFIGSNFGRSILLFNAGGGVYYLAGRNNKFLELGTDLSYLNVDVVSDDQFRFGNFVAPAYNTSTLYTTFNIGYRRYGKRSMFRTGIAPGFTNKEWLPGGYISFGICF